MSAPLRGNQKEVVLQKVKVSQLPLSTDSFHILGDIHRQYGNWEKLTSDQVILRIIEEGITIDFHTTPPPPPY